MSEASSEKPSPLEIALKARQFELELFWRRALFFWGFIAAAFVGLASTYSRHPFIAMTLSCFGMVCSLSWTLANRGSKYWYQTWEDKAKSIGGEEIRKLFENNPPNKDNKRWHGERWSVSRLAIALSEFTFVLWVGILAYQVAEYITHRCLRLNVEYVALGVLLSITVIYVYQILRNARGATRKP